MSDGVCMNNASSGPLLLHSNSQGFSMDDAGKIVGSLRCYPQFLWFQACPCTVTYVPSSGFTLSSVSDEGFHTTDNISERDVLSVVELGGDEGGRGEEEDADDDEEATCFELRYKRTDVVVVQVMQASTRYERRMWCTAASRQLSSSLFHWLGRPLLHRIFHCLDPDALMTLRRSSVHLWRASSAHFRRALRAPFVWPSGRFALPKSVVVVAADGRLEPTRQLFSSDDGITACQVSAEDESARRDGLRFSLTEHPMDSHLCCGVIHEFNKTPGKAYYLELRRDDTVLAASAQYSVPVINAMWDSYDINLSTERIVTGEGFTVSVTPKDAPEENLRACLVMAREGAWGSDDKYEWSKSFRHWTREIRLTVASPSATVSIREPMLPGTWYLAARGFHSKEPLSRDDCVKLVVERPSNWAAVGISLVDCSSVVIPRQPIKVRVVRPKELAFSGVMVLMIRDMTGELITSVSVPPDGSEELNVTIDAPRLPGRGFELSLSTTEFGPRVYCPITLLEQPISVQWSKEWNNCELLVDIDDDSPNTVTVKVKYPEALHMTVARCATVAISRGSEFYHSYDAIYDNGLCRDLKLPHGEWTFLLRRGHFDVLKTVTVRVVNEVPLLVEPALLEFDVTAGGVEPSSFEVNVTSFPFQQPSGGGSISTQIISEEDPQWMCFLRRASRDGVQQLSGSSGSFTHSGVYVVRTVWKNLEFQRGTFKVIVNKKTKKT